MPRTHALSEQDVEQSKSKRQKLTSSQLERKRELDREAQRTIRERTKNHIAHLESLVQQLQGDHGGQVQRLVTQLNESRAEVNRLRDALNSIIKISASVTGLGSNSTISPFSDDENVKQEATASSPSARTSPPGRSTRTCSDAHTILTIPNSEREDVQPKPQQFSFHAYSGLGSLHNGNEVVDHSEPIRPQKDVVEDVEIGPDEDTVHLPPPPTINVSDDHLSVSQMAASIVANSKLEGRYWYLAGVLLTQILKKQQQGGFVNFANDEDIANRAVFEGWSSVLERYPLDRGWQWLKELDETIYFHHFGPAERLMNLRNCRYQFLHQCYPDAGWDKNLPNFYATRSTQQYVEGDPLVEHFPWPGFRKHLMYSPRKFATNKFMESLRRNLRFVWNHDPQALYSKDPFSGQYLYSDLFLKHIFDIKCYSARPEFFKNFPELEQDIPWNRMEDPSPINVMNHRFSVGSNSTTSTGRLSPVRDDNDEMEPEGKNVDLEPGTYSTSNSNSNSHNWHVTIGTTNS